jgi:cell wall-associated NlpC family hydrolase
MPASNAVVVSAPPASVTALAARIKAILPRGAAVEPLVTLAAQAQAGVPSSEAAGSAGLSTAQLTTALRAAESRQGRPYAWGADGPASPAPAWSVVLRLVGVPMPPVAADQPGPDPRVPVEASRATCSSTTPARPPRVHLVAIYLGNGWMIQAPQPGLRVQVVPANFGSQFAGAIRVSPRIAAALSGGLA